jgi:tripartite-type tricarboxylate transporter receptor subunit TctC
MMSGSSIVMALSAAVLTAISNPAFAQAPYPNKVIRVVTAAAGSNNDWGARMVGDLVAPALGQRFVVENRGGLAVEVVAKAPPDGYTLLFYGSAAWTQHLFRDVDFDPQRDLAPITLAMSSPILLVVHPSLPVKSLKELLALARSKPGELSYSSSGIYGALHMPMEMFLHAAKLKMRHVPTTGGGPAITALLGGHVEMTAGGPAAITSHVKAGKLRPLASWGAKRHEAYPDVPTFKELGYDVEYYIWAGMFAPKGTPEPVLKVLRDGTRKAVQDADFKTAMARVNSPVQYLDAPEFRKYWEADAKRLATVVKAVGKVEETK